MSKNQKYIKIPVLIRIGKFGRRDLKSKGIWIANDSYYLNVTLKMFQFFLKHKVKSTARYLNTRTQYTGYNEIRNMSLIVTDLSEAQADEKYVAPVLQYSCISIHINFLMSEPILI